MQKKDLVRLRKSIVLSDSDFFKSNAYRRYMENSISIFCSKYGYRKPVDLQLSWETETLAQTNFEKIILSPLSDFFDKEVSISDRFEMTKGVLVHELSHIFFTERRATFSYKMFQSLLPYLGISAFSKEERKAIQEKITKEKEGLWTPFYQEISNLIEDGFIEKAFLIQNSGMSKNALIKLRSYQKEKMLQEKEEIFFSKNSEDAFSRMKLAILLYAKYQEVHPFYKELKSDHVLIQEGIFLENQVFPIIEKAVNETDSATRELYKYLAYDAMKPFFRQIPSQIIKDMSDKVSIRQGKEFFDLIPFEIKDTWEEKQQERPLSMNPFPKEDFQAKKEDLFTKSPDFFKVYEEAMDNVFEKRVQELFYQEEAARSSLFSEKQFPTKIYFPQTENKEQYRNILKEVQILSRRMQQKFLEKLRKRKIGFTEKNLYLGKKLDSEKIYKEDGKVFLRKTLPSDIADLCIGILVDESASMNRLVSSSYLPRCYYAKKTAILLDDFCRGLEIPHTIYGHTADISDDPDEISQSLDIIPYIPFESPEFLKYGLTEIKGRQENRDGHAIEYIAKQMKERPERKKIIFCITDGVPLAWHYGGKEAMEHTRKAIRKYSRDILFIGLCIAEESQKKEISSMYDKMLFIKDLNDLPKTAIRLIANHI